MDGQFNLLSQIVKAELPKAVMNVVANRTIAGQHGGLRNVADFVLDSSDLGILVAQVRLGVVVVPECDVVLGISVR